MPRQPEMKRWRPKESDDNGNSFGIDKGKRCGIELETSVSSREI
jgi:hypothetical protein